MGAEGRQMPRGSYIFLVNLKIEDCLGPLGARRDCSPQEHGFSVDGSL